MKVEWLVMDWWWYRNYDIKVCILKGLVRDICFWFSLFVIE